MELPGTFPSGGLKVQYNTTWFTFAIIYLLPPIVCKLTVMYFLQFWLLVNAVQLVNADRPSVA